MGGVIFFSSISTMLRTIYTHTRNIYVEVMKTRIIYHIPTYGEDEIMKILSLQRKEGGFVIELERKPLPPVLENLPFKMNEMK
jgi:hypothetical protein